MPKSESLDPRRLEEIGVEFFSEFALCEFQKVRLSH